MVLDDPSFGRGKVEYALDCLCLDRDPEALADREADMSVQQVGVATCRILPNGEANTATFVLELAFKPGLDVRRDRRKQGDKLPMNNELTLKAYTIIGV